MGDYHWCGRPQFMGCLLGNCTAIFVFVLPIEFSDICAQFSRDLLEKMHWWWKLLKVPATAAATSLKIQITKWRASKKKSIKRIYIHKEILRHATCHMPHVEFKVATRAAHPWANWSYVSVSVAASHMRSVSYLQTFQLSSIIGLFINEALNFMGR